MASFLWAETRFCEICFEISFIFHNEASDFIYLFSIDFFFLFIFANEVSGLLEVGMVINIDIILPLAILVGTAIDKFSTLSRV